MNKHIFIILLTTYSFTINPKMPKSPYIHKCSNLDDENLITYKDDTTKQFKTYNFSNQTLHFEEYFINQNSGCPGYFYP